MRNSTSVARRWGNDMYLSYGMIFYYERIYKPIFNPFQKSLVATKRCLRDRKLGWPGESEPRFSIKCARGSYRLFQLRHKNHPSCVSKTFFQAHFTWIWHINPRPGLIHRIRSSSKRIGILIKCRISELPEFFLPLGDTWPRVRYKMNECKIMQKGSQICW